MRPQRLFLLLLLLNLLVMSAVAFWRSSRLTLPKGERWRMTGVELLFRFLPLSLKIWLVLSTVASLLLVLLWS
jgi:hypothetical protein